MGHDVFFHEGAFGAYCYFHEEPAGWVGWVLFVRAADEPNGEGPGYRRLIPGGPFSSRDDALEAALPFVQRAVKDGSTGL